MRHAPLVSLANAADLGQTREHIQSGTFTAWADELLRGPLGKDPEGPPGGAGGGRRGKDGKVLGKDEWIMFEGRKRYLPVISVSFSCEDQQISGLIIFARFKGRLKQKSLFPLD